MTGYDDPQGHRTGRFGPTSPVTVAEALKIAVTAAGYDISVHKPEGTGWLAPYLGVARDEGLFPFGALDGPSFDSRATRGEVAQMLADAFHVKVPTDPIVVVRRGYYADVSSTAAYLYPIEALTRDGVVAGDSDSQGRFIGRFRPNDPINRAEVAKMIVTARRVYGIPNRN